MRQRLLRGLDRAVRRWGYEVVPVSAGPLDDTVAPIAERVRPFTMTSDARIAGLVDAVRYVVRHRIPGAVVECGVWRGGSTMAAALALIDAGDVDRDLYLFDTFEGMPPPADVDVDRDGRSAADLLDADRSRQGVVWAVAGLDDVRANLATTGYPAGRLHFVAGRVEDTIPGEAPSVIAVLRLDTDWYESTRHELEHLLGRVSPGGVLIVDDYGHWAGARKAVDEHLEATGRRLLLVRLDDTGRMAVVP